MDDLLAELAALCSTLGAVREEVRLIGGLAVRLQSARRRV
jgi:hypothetical protein